MLCSQWLCFAASSVTAVSFSAAGLTVSGLSGLVAAAMPPFGLRLVLIKGAIVVYVIFICACVCFIRFVGFTVTCRNDTPTGNVAKDVAIWQTSVSCKSYVVQKNQEMYVIPKIDLSQSTYYMYHIWWDQIFKGRSNLG